MDINHPVNESTATSHVKTLPDLRLSAMLQGAESDRQTEDLQPWDYEEIIKIARIKTRCVTQFSPPPFWNLQKSYIVKRRNHSSIRIISQEAFIWCCVVFHSFLFLPFLINSLFALRMMRENKMTNPWQLFYTWNSLYQVFGSGFYKREGSLCNFG